MYYVNGYVLDNIRDVLETPVNSVSICKDINTPEGEIFVVIVIKDRNIAKNILYIMENSEKAHSGSKQGIIATFTAGEDMCLLFPYRPERRLSTFGKGQEVSLYVKETICLNLVSECISLPLAYPILYLCLDDKNIHLTKDNNVYLTPYIDFQKLDLTITEKDCAAKLAEISLSLLDSNKRRKAKSCEILYKKLRRNAFNSLIDLYKDIKQTAIPFKKKNKLDAAKGVMHTKKDKMFKILLVACVVIVAIALLLLITQLIFGDIPLFRLFKNMFDIIGTQSLVRGEPI